MFRAAIVVTIILLLWGCSRPAGPVPVTEEVQLDANSTSGSNRPQRLSDYKFFTGKASDLKLANDVFSYAVNAPLFSDYAHKARFIRLPNGKSMNYHPDDLMEFPEGTIIGKTFYYPADFRKPDEARRLLETRLLILEKNGWQAMTYVWNDEQTDAFLEVAGTTREVTWTHNDGAQRSVKYLVPNQNQCKNCHLRGTDLQPIGPTARQLNHETATGNQLKQWSQAGILNGLPASDVGKLADYSDESLPVESRARAWLETNCAHCHRPDGPAKTSGLHLLANVHEPLHLGIGKAPVAAGKGSGGLSFDIVPGQPEKSILLFRMQSTDPGIMMPELGRTLKHEEGIELVTEWIRSINPIQP